MNSSDYSPTEHKITGKSYDEIKEILWDRYGSNYHIIDQRTILEGGFLGFFQKAMIEVTYIISDRQKSAREDVAQAKEQILQKAGVDYSKVVSMQYGELEKIISDMNGQLTELRQAAASQVHPSIKKIEDILSENEFTHSFISYISNRIKNEFSLEQLEDFDKVQEKVVDWIGQSIKIEPNIPHKLPHIIVLVGPTGLGKTTTISKMAAKPILDAKKSGRPLPVVRLVTIDHTRVGAEQQLRKYGTIMGVQVDKAEDSNDLSEIIKKCRDSADYIFIDTSGYSPKDYDNIAKMRNILDVPELALDTYLVVAASTKASDLSKIIDNFSMFNFSSVIITKCDETSSYGNVLSVLFEKKKSISFITYGQKVPLDIKRASVREFLYKLSDIKKNKIHIDDMFPEGN